MKFISSRHESTRASSSKGARFNTGELGPVSLRMALEDSQTIIHLGVIFTIDLVCRN